MLFLKKDATIAQIYQADPKTRLARPLFLSTVAAGFPSPADDYIDRELDLNDYLIANPAATFFVRVAGDSMVEAGIRHDDILVVDRALEPRSGRIVIAIIDRELTVKRFIQNGECCHLIAENPDYPDIELSDGMDLEVWGVVTWAVHKV